MAQYRQLCACSGDTNTLYWRQTMSEDVPQTSTDPSPPAPLPPGAIRTRKALHWMGEDGIVRVRYTSDEPETEQEAREHVAMLRRLSPISPVVLLVDARNGATTMSPAVRAQYTSDAAVEVIAALAILVGTPGSRLVGNMFLRFQHARIRTRLFSDEALAIRWLQSQRVGW
jgi:hypothetical protein